MIASPLNVGSFEFFSTGAGKQHGLVSVDAGAIGDGRIARSAKGFKGAGE
jgi:hypothetical protein